MVIQRWQTVWLLFAAVLAVVFCFVPMAIVSSDAATPESVKFLNPIDVVEVLYVTVVVALLQVLAIFMFKNMARQRTTVLVSMLLLVVDMISVVCIVEWWDGGEGYHLDWMGSIFLLIGSLAFSALAYRGIRHDEKLLRAADRLR